MIERMKKEIKEAMLTKDEVTKNTLRMVLGNAQLEAKMNKEEFSETHLLNAINKEMKQTQQALQVLKEKNQEFGTFYEETVKRIEVLKRYLPKQLNEEELETEIRKLLVDLDKSNKGLVMKTVMTALKGRADGKLINKIVMKVLAE